jgi:hypothetical protein
MRLVDVAERHDVIRLKPVEHAQKGLAPLPRADGADPNPVVGAENAVIRSRCNERRPHKLAAV